MVTQITVCKPPTPLYYIISVHFIHSDGESSMNANLRENSISNTLLKILYMSGYNDDEVMRHGVSFTDTTFLQKPFTRDLLIQRIQKTMGRGSRGAGGKGAEGKEAETRKIQRRESFRGPPDDNAVLLDERSTRQFLYRNC